VAKFVLRYNADPINPPSAAFPQRMRTFRPRIAVVLATQVAAFPCYALVDSGADDCIFPASFGAQLGLNVYTGRHYAFGGAGGGGSQNAYFFDLQITLQNIARYRIPVGFSTALEDFGIGLLGQNGFFDSRSRLTSRKGYSPSLAN
jgi:Aspartyl protease